MYTLGVLLFSGEADPEKLNEEVERVKYDVEMKAAAQEEAAKAQILPTNFQTEKTGIEKRIREGNDDKVFKVCTNTRNLKYNVSKYKGQYSKFPQIRGL